MAQQRTVYAQEYILLQSEEIRLEAYDNGSPIPPTINGVPLTPNASSFTLQGFLAPSTYMVGGSFSGSGTSEGVYPVTVHCNIFGDNVYLGLPFIVGTCNYSGPVTNRFILFWNHENASIPLASKEVNQESYLFVNGSAVQGRIFITEEDRNIQFESNSNLGAGFTGIFGPTFTYNA